MQQRLSPEKYIQTKARSLPIYKCYVSKGWEEGEMSSVVVIRKHVNGNCTVGFYLVDLLCLGIKDSFYFFNQTEEEINEKIDPDALFLEETDYNTAHNIMYAGHDFAMDFDIQPHKLFAVTKFILEEDDDKIPLIEIHTGDENGNPHLLINSSYNYGPILQKLKKNAGEGNYTFTILENEWDEYDDDLTDLEDDDDWDDDEDEEDDDEDASLDSIEKGLLDFQLLSNFSTAEILEAVENESRSELEKIIIRAALLFRRLAATEPGTVPETEDVIKTEDYLLYENTIEQNHLAAEANKAGQQLIYEKTREIGAKDPLAAGTAKDYISLLQKSSFNELNAFMVLQAMPVHVVLSNFDEIQKDFHRYMPAAQLVVAAYALLLRKHPYSNYQFILDAQNAAQAYPSSNNIHALQHRLFWFVKALHAIEQNDKQNIIHYQSLLNISGIGGNIKYLYAAQFGNWLAKYMDIEQNSVMAADEE